MVKIRRTANPRPHNYANHSRNFSYKIQLQILLLIMKQN